MALTRKVAQATTVLLARHGRLAHQPYRRLHASTSRLGPESNPVLSEDGALKVPSDTTITTALTTEPREGWLYIDSVFPTRLAQWDLRHYIGVIRSDTILSRLEEIFSAVHTHGFSTIAVEPHPKDGGVFVRFRYTPSLTTDADARDALKDIQAALESEALEHGGVPNWMGWKTGSIWLIKGRPWKEDMNRFASPILKVSFDGPDIQEEALYNLLRPYGRIQDIALPAAVPAGTLRTSTITFRQLRSATIARNAIHGLDFQPLTGPSGNAPPRTRIRTAYQPAVQAHAIRDWLAKHPKIVFPVVLFLLGTLTYTIFDPIRTYMVEGKVMDWFDYREYDIYKWIRRNTVGHLPSGPSPAPPAIGTATSDHPPTSPGEHSHATHGDKKHGSKEGEAVWQERQDAQIALERYLDDLPSTITFVHGPQGSGKTRMFTGIVQDSERRTLIIDCAELLRNPTDSSLVDALARQTGYWPVFTFLNNFNTWIDLASVGIIGQKAGLATSLPAQVQQVLAVVGDALAHVSTAYRADITRAAEAERKREERRVAYERRKERIRRGEWHDGRLDCVAGNGVMSELGVGDERMDQGDVTAPAAEGVAAGPPGPKEVTEEKQSDVKRDAEVQDGGEKAQDGTEKEGWFAAFPSVPSLPSMSLPTASSISSKLFGAASNDAVEPTPADAEDDPEGTRGRQRAPGDTSAVRALPVLVIKNFGMRTGANKNSEEVLDVLATWAAGLAENQIAHVIVMSDNRENAKRIAKALPSKPLNSIALADADTASALSFVKQKLHEADIHVRFDPDETAHLERLGGRASDLESLVHKVRSGLTIQGAVEDIVRRDVGELRKNAFGDDAEDAKGLPWAREQAWQLFKQLTKKEELAYYDVLVDLFKNDETALRNMEHAELIAIGTENGRPSTIRPGKPVYKYVFQRLVSDPVFRATQDLAVNEKATASAEGVVKTCEDELLRLRELGSSRTARRRENYVLDKMHAAQGKIEALEASNVEFKKVLAKGG